MRQSSEFRNSANTSDSTVYYIKSFFATKRVVYAIKGLIL